jgi:hypothetical protein
MHECQQSKLSSSVNCPVCGQGFLIFTEPSMPASQVVSRRIVIHALRSHHVAHSTSPSAHPGSTFHIPSWSGAQPFFASAVLSNLLDTSL